MLFPQFAVYQKKKSFNYVEINDLLVITINLKQVWYWDSFKNATHNTWMTFKDKLSTDQKIVFKNAIKKLRELFLNKMNKMNVQWLSVSIVATLLSIITPSIKHYPKRQVILKQGYIQNPELTHLARSSL